MKILAGITFDNDVYFLEVNQMTPKFAPFSVNPPKERQEYFSMTGETIRPLEYSEAVEQSRQSLEDGELWKQAVETGNTEMGLQEWIDFVLDTDGELSMIDNSLYPEQIETTKGTFIFESGACGQHEEKDLKEYFLPKKDFHELLRIWENYHLKKSTPKIPEISFDLRNEESIKEKIKEWIERNPAI